MVTPFKSLRAESTMQTGFVWICTACSVLLNTQQAILQFK